MQKIDRIWISRLFQDDFCHPFFHNQKHPQSTSDSNTYGYLGMRGAPHKMAIISLHHQDDIRFLDTPWKFNISPEKWWLEDYFPFGVAYFQGRTVKLPGGNTIRLGDPEPTFHFKLLLGGGFIPKVTTIIIIHNFLRGKHNLLQESLTKFFTIRRCSCWFWKKQPQIADFLPKKNYVKERTPHFWIFLVHTPRKLNMEPDNHPIEKANHLNQTSILGFQALICWCVNDDQHQIHVNVSVVVELDTPFETHPNWSWGMSPIWWGRNTNIKESM